MYIYFVFIVEVLMTWIYDAGAQASPQLPVEDIVNGIRAVENSIVSLRVDANIEGVLFPPNFPHTGVQLRFAERVTVDKSQRTRHEIEGQDFKIINGKPEFRPLKKKGTYNGTEARIARGAKQYNLGSITDSRADLGLIIDPIQITTNFYSEPVSKILTDRKAKVVGSVDHDGRSVLVLETDPIHPKDSWKYRFLVDPGLNFAVVKRSQLFKFAGTQTWLDFDCISNHKYKEFMPGVWLPTEIHIKCLDPRKEDLVAGTDPKVRHEWMVKVDNWDVNPEIADSTFNLIFDPGTQVEDRINNRSFQVTGIDDAKLD
jgi:hypothetical protein